MRLSPFQLRIAHQLEHQLLDSLIANHQFLGLVRLVGPVGLVVGVYFVLVILNLMVNEFHGLELPVSVHLVKMGANQVGIASKNGSKLGKALKVWMSSSWE
jgi:hypothetical protein